VSTGDPQRVRRALEDAGVRFVLLHRDQPTSAEQARFFDGETVVVRDRWIVLYDLGPVGPPDETLPPWRWSGLGLTALTVLLVAIGGAASRRRERSAGAGATDWRVAFARDRTRR
jgi:hypothetical protein